MAKTNRTKAQGGDPYENLANAIVLQAVSDYRMARRAGTKEYRPRCCGSSIRSGLGF